MLVFQMKGLTFSLILIVLLMSSVSAEIIINTQPGETYNLGDIVSVPITIKAVSDVTNIFQMDLLCEGHEINFYKNGVSLSAGAEKKLDASVVLVSEMIGELSGECKIKAMLGEDYVLTEEFKISKALTIQIDAEQTEFNPGELILVSGSAIKENGKDVNGFVDLELVLSAGNDTSANILQPGTINNGFFSVEIPIPADLGAGSYLVKLNAYEKDFLGAITNNGVSSYSITVRQVPTNLEMILENEEVAPGTNLKLKTILHDQTGEVIESSSLLTIKDDNNLVMEQIEITNSEDFEYAVKYNQAPAQWKVQAESNGLTTETKFTIPEKASVNVKIINKTVEIINNGNVLYNKTVLVKIGDESLNIYVNLKVDESRKYVLKAPDGEYSVEVITEEGNQLSETTTLTGKAIGIEEAKGTVAAAMQSPIIWIFLILVLGALAFFCFRKIRKKPFSLSFKGFGFKKKDKQESREIKKISKSSLIISNPAELSLSIKGDKQGVDIICLKVNNLEELNSVKGNAKDTIQNIVKIAEEQKASVYENQENLFFIFAPINTRTYKNEKSAIKLAKEIKEILSEHNQSSAQKIDFGISANHGDIIAKKEPHSLKFMSLGSTITAAKKIASLSKREILLSEKMNAKIATFAKTEKHTREKVPVYIIKQMRRDDEESKKFIRSFLKRMDKKD